MAINWLHSLIHILRHYRIYVHEIYPLVKFLLLFICSNDVPYIFNIGISSRIRRGERERLRRIHVNRGAIPYSYIDIWLFNVPGVRYRYTGPRFKMLSERTL